jgi:hypothetical protein
MAEVRPGRYIVARLAAEVATCKLQRGNFEAGRTENSPPKPNGPAELVARERGQVGLSLSTDLSPVVITTRPRMRVSNGKPEGLEFLVSRP